MRVLLIEDEESAVDQISAGISARCEVEIHVARSRNSALDKLSEGVDFDLIVCDLRIPTSDGGLDHSEDHGFHVHDEARAAMPGTPSIFFSAYVSLANVRSRLAGAGSMEIGNGLAWPLVDVLVKEELPTFLDKVEQLAGALQDIDNLPIEETAGSVGLTTHELRPIRMYATGLGGHTIRARRLGGLSGAKVLGVEVLDERGDSIGSVVAKVDFVDRIVDELRRYSNHVAPLLGIGDLAHEAGRIMHGAGRYGAAAYRLAAGWRQDLFEAVTHHPQRVATAISDLQSKLAPWAAAVAIEDVPVVDLRSRRVASDRLVPFEARLEEFDWRTLEESTVSMRFSVVHGDLHGKNVLINDAGTPLMIDYGDVGRGPSLVDPVTLELSFLVHDESPDFGGWPPVEQAGHWFDLDRYLIDSPIAEVITACRTWIDALGTTPAECAAMVYAHATRQLKYPDTDKDLALAIAGAAARVFREST